MRWLAVAFLVLCGCDDEARYADGALWSQIMPVNPGRVPPSEMNSRQWAQFLSESGLQGDDVSRKFTPTNWSGFSADPVGEISYFDFGEIVMLWRGDNLLGTSDATDMSFDGVPQKLWPSTPRSFRCVLGDNTTNKAGLATISSAGLMSFSLENVSGTHIIFNNIGFTPAADKGLPQGWFMVYAKDL